jgi:hypothetical protein
MFIIDIKYIITHQKNIFSENEKNIFLFFVGPNGFNQFLKKITEKITDWKTRWDAMGGPRGRTDNKISYNITKDIK